MTLEWVKFLLELKWFQVSSLVPHHQQTCSKIWEFRLQVQMFILQQNMEKNKMSPFRVSVAPVCSAVAGSQNMWRGHSTQPDEVTLAFQKRWQSVISATSLGFGSVTLATLYVSDWLFWNSDVNRLRMERLWYHLPCILSQKTSSWFLAIINK